MGRRVVLKEFLAELEENGIEIETADGQIFILPPPEIWPDEVDEVMTEVETAKVVMGDQYAAFVKAGGNARVLGSIIKGGWEATVPESSASAASSTSTRRPSKRTSSRSTGSTSAT